VRFFGIKLGSVWHDAETIVGYVGDEDDKDKSWVLLKNGMEICVPHPQIHLDLMMASITETMMAIDESKQ
jgi:hypothetical protein